MRFTYSQSSFRSGRLSPKLYQRIDSQQYRDGASRMENCRVLPEGGAERLKGTRWIDDASTNTTGRMFTIVIAGTPVRCILDNVTGGGPTYTSVLYTQPYPFASAPTTTILSQGSSSEYYPAEGYDWAIADKTLVLTHSRGTMPPIYVTFTEAGAVESRKSTGMYAYTLGDENFYPGLDLTGYTGSFSSRVFPFSDVGSYGDLTIGAIASGQFNVTSTDATVQAILKRSNWIYLEGLGSNTFGGANAQTFVVSCFALVTDTTIANGVKVAPEALYTPAGGGTATSMVHIGGLTTIKNWAYPLWWGARIDGSTDGSWPRTVTAHEGRVVFGGTKEHPTTLFGSAINSIYHFNQLRYLNTLVTTITAPTPSGDTVMTDPYILKVRAKEDSRITFIQSAESLVIGTDRKEYIATGGDTILSGLALNVKPVSAQGSMPSKSVSTGKSVYFLSSEGKQLFRFRYNEANGSFASQELSMLFSDKLELDRIKQVEWCPHIQSLMILMESGALYGLTQNDQSDIVAFYDTGITDINSVAFLAVRSQDLHVTADAQYHRGDMILLLHETYGLMTMEQLFYERGIDESGIVEDINQENAYLYYERGTLQRRTAVNTFTFNGTDYTYSGTSSGADQDKFMIPVDIYPVGTALKIVDLDTMTEYDYTVQANPSAYDYLPIEDDDVNALTTIFMGVAEARTMVAATMPVEAGQQWGTAQMGIKNIDTLGIRHYKTYSYEISSDGETWQEVNVTGDDAECTTGRKETKFTSNPRYDQIVYIRNTRAEPCTITGINMRGVSNDG
jgi:hypothetical protein